MEKRAAKVRVGDGGFQFASMRDAHGGLPRRDHLPWIDQRLRDDAVRPGAQRCVFERVAGQFDRAFGSSEPSARLLAAGARAIERRLSDPSLAAQFRGALLVGQGLRLRHARGGEFGVGLLLLQPQILLVERGDWVARLHLLSDFDEALDDLSGDPETLVRLNPRTDCGDKFARLRLGGVTGRRDQHRPVAVLARLGGALILRITGGKPRRQKRGERMKGRAITEHHRRRSVDESPVQGSG